MGCARENECESVTFIVGVVRQNPRGTRWFYEIQEVLGSSMKYKGYRSVARGYQRNAVIGAIRISTYTLHVTNPPIFSRQPDNILL